MRNTTKLKLLLQQFTATFDLDDDGIFTLILLDKTSNEHHDFTGESYSIVISKAYSFFLRKLKKNPE